LTLTEKTRNPIYGFTNFLLLFSTLLIIQISIVAQKEMPIFEQLSVEQGLSFNLVTDMVQDKKGFMWFATADGLNRFDGYAFKVLKPNPLDTNSLTAAYINRLFTDSYGTIWANVVGYLHRYDEVNGTFNRLLQGMWLTSMCEDTSKSSNSGMWFSTYGQGLHWWGRKENKFTHYHHEPQNLNSLISDSLLSVFVDRSGILWVGTSRGLNSLDMYRKNIKCYPNGPKGRVYDIIEDPFSNGSFIWIGTDHGLYKYDKKSDQFYQYKNPFAKLKNVNDNDIRNLYSDSWGKIWIGMIDGIAGFDVKSEKYFTYYDEIQSYPWAYITKSWFIQEDPNGTIWALARGGTSSSPLLRFNSEIKKFVPYPAPPEAPLILHSLFIDKIGTMWLGTLDRGVLKIDASRKPFHNYLYTPELNEDGRVPVIAGITGDISGDIWLGSDNGLYRFDPRSELFTHYKNNPKNITSLSNNDIGPVMSDKSGNIWIGTDGVDIYDRKRNIFLHHNIGWIDSFVETHDGVVWLGANDGSLKRYIQKLNSFKDYHPDYSEAFDHIIMLGLVEDPEGIIWFILRGSGLLSFDRKTNAFKRYYNSPKPYSPPITLATLGLSSLLTDKKGNLWIGTDAGVIKYEKSTGEFSAITEQNGIASQNVSGILEDNKGFMWFGTTKGLSKYDPQSGKLWNFDEYDGLKFGQVIKTTGYKSKNGEMYFGGSKGFVRFHPDSLKQNQHIPPIFITSFKVLGKEVILDTAITDKKHFELSYKDNVISFGFVALNYSSTQKNQYAYKLEGFDDNWIYCGTRRSATYTNLDGGTYIFHVKGSNNDGIWNEQGASIIIVITPPFWATWWFRILAFVVLLISVGGTIRFIELRKIKRRIELLEKEQAFERERARISRDMHDEVGSSLSEIVILSELAMKKPKEANLHVREISERAAEVIDNVSDIVWAMNPKNDKLDNLIAHVRHYAIKYLSLANIACQFTAPENIPAKNISAQLRRNIFLVIKEALHNVVKHSEAANVTIIIEFSNDIFFTLLKDNGKGFLIENISGAGNGLINMKKRIEDIKGEIEFRSNPGEGTQISFSVMLNNYFN
jgi:ligand-binding sensor domain-containing protein/signal transduction histidine kinase